MKAKVRYLFAFLLAASIVLFLILGLFGAAINIMGQNRLNAPDTLDMGTFSVVYDSALLIPVTADWLLIDSYLGKTKRVPSWRFAEDYRVPRPRATHDDYTNSGFDRGHLCPAADRSVNSKVMKSTFIMTNVCPQVPALNRGAWKRMEDNCRNLVKKGVQLAVHVDAVFWPADTQRIGIHGVAVPHGFVKTVRDVLTDTICYSKYFQNW